MGIVYHLSKFIKKIHIPSVINSNIDRTAKVCSGSQVVDTELGRYSYIGNNCTVISAMIGNFCSIADYCIIGGSSHPTDWVSSSPVFIEGRNVLRKNFSKHCFRATKPIAIGSDVWIGSGCLIRSGVNIGDGAVVGMGSVLTKDVGPYEIWAGNPARFIRKRFSDEIITEFMRIKWWEWDDLRIKSSADFFNDPNKFIEERKQ